MPSLSTVSSPVRLTRLSSTRLQQPHSHAMPAWGGREGQDGEAGRERCRAAVWPCKAGGQVGGYGRGGVARKGHGVTCCDAAGGRVLYGVAPEGDV